MWCVPKLTPEFIKRMEDILDLYAKPYDKSEPVLCLDEKREAAYRRHKSSKKYSRRKPEKTRLRVQTEWHKEYLCNGRAERRTPRNNGNATPQEARLCSRG